MAPTPALHPGLSTTRLPVSRPAETGHSPTLFDAMDDTELNHILQGCLRRQTSSYRALYDRFHPYVLGICHRYADRKEDVEDLMQEVFALLFARLDSLKDLKAFPLWMKRVTINHCLDHVKKKRLSLQAMTGKEVEQYPSTDPDTTGLLQGVTPEQLHEEILKLPYGYRVVLNMFAIDGMSHKEIAQRLRISENTSRTQYMKAKQALKKRLEDYMLNSR